MRAYEQTDKDYIDTWGCDDKMVSVARGLLFLSMRYRRSSYLGNIRCSAALL